MKNSETLNWNSFKETLQENPELDLQFQYTEDKWVSPSYHITEIKQAPIVSVDCGGVMNSWTEIIVQLWEPEEKQQERAMKVRKALSIIGTVEKVLPLNPLAIVKIEFGNSQFDTRQMYLNEFIINGNNLIVDLRADSVQCKAIGRGGSCGTPEKGGECCGPAIAEVKPVIQLKNLASAAVCSPGSGCC